MSLASLALLAGPISNESGPGLFLRIIVLASIVGVGVLAWILVRAGRDNNGRDN